MPDYSKSKIYLIRNTVNDMVYVGSTVESLANRFAGHKAAWKEEKTLSPIYKAFTELGIEAFYIELYEEYPCDNKEQKTKKEGEVIRLLKDTAYNVRIEGRTQKQYQTDNREQIAAQRKQYRTDNQEQIAAGKRIYSDANKETIAIKAKERYNANIDVRRTKMRAYYYAKKAAQP